MYPICMHENEVANGINFKTFSQEMLKICNEHKRANKALAFAFILCDFKNPQVWKILNNTDYWLALNDISGEYLSVFSLNYDSMKKMTSNPTNTLIEKYFKETQVNYPALLFFQVDNESVIDSFLIDLKEQEIEKSFLELKDYLKKAVNALTKITPENKQNIREIFNCLEAEVKPSEIAKIKWIIGNAGSVIALISAIKGMS